MAYDELHTALVEVEAILNSRPISYFSSEDMEEPLTPSHLLIGCRLCTLPDPVICSRDLEFEGTNAMVDLSRRMRHLNLILEHFWKRWRLEYLVGLRESHAYSPRSQNARSTLAPGDVVLVHDSDQPRMQWRLGRVERLLEGSDGAVRGASLRVQSGKKTSLLNRPIRHLYPLETSITTDAATTHCATDQTPEPRSEGHEDEPEPVRATPVDDGSSGEGRTVRPRPQRLAAQIARYRLEELARDPC